LCVVLMCVLVVRFFLPLSSFLLLSVFSFQVVCCVDVCASNDFFLLLSSF